MNRQIRRMCEVLGYNVTALKRTRIMNITTSGLPIGKWRHFTANEIVSLNKLVADSSKTGLPENNFDGMEE